MSDSTARGTPVRKLRKFGSFEDQEADDLRYWLTRTVAQKLEAAADLARHAYGIRPNSGSDDDMLTRLAPVFDAQGREIPPSRVLRKFNSFEEQEAWNQEFARKR